MTAADLITRDVRVRDKEHVCGRERVKDINKGENVRDRREARQCGRESENSR